MSLDENVVIRMTAEHEQALSAWDALAAKIRKTLEDAGDGAENNSKKMNAFSETFEDVSKNVLASASAASLFEKAMEAAADLADKRFEALANKSNALREALDQLTGKERSWQDFALPGENIGKISEQIEAVGKSGGMGAGAVHQALAALVQKPRHGESTLDLVSDIGAVAEPGLGSQQASDRVTMMRDFMRRFPGASREGALAEIGRRGSDAPDQLKAIEGLQTITHGADSFQAYSSFSGMLGTDLESGQKEKAAAILLRRLSPFTQSQSLADAMKFLGTTTGHQIGVGMAGEVQTGTGDFEPTGEGRELTKNPRVAAMLQSLFRGDLKFNPAGEPGLNDPGVIAGEQKRRAAIAGQARVQSSAASLVASGAIEGITGGDPDAIYSKAVDDTLKHLEDRGFMSGPTSLRGGIGREKALTLEVLSDRTPGVRARGEARGLEQIAGLVSKAGEGASPETAAAIREMVAELKIHTAVLRKLGDTKQRDDQHGAATPAAAAGG